MNHRGIVNRIHLGHARMCERFPLAPRRGAGRVGGRDRWYRCARPPANFWEPSGRHPRATQPRISAARFARIRVLGGHSRSLATSATKYTSASPRQTPFLSPLRGWRRMLARGPGARAPGYSLPSLRDCLNTCSHVHYLLCACTLAAAPPSAPARGVSGSAALRTSPLGLRSRLRLSWYWFLGTGPSGTAATRKPRRPPRSAGPIASRHAGRQLWSQSTQLPPRGTRAATPFCQTSAHHSQTFPAISRSPNLDLSRGKMPTGEVTPNLPSLLQIPLFPLVAPGILRPLRT